MRTSTIRGHRLAAAVSVAGLLLAGSPAIAAPPAAAAPAPADDASALRIGVVAVTSAISAIGQTPELSTPLPFATTSLADVLGLDESLASHLQQALLGTDLEEALDEVEGITLVEDNDDSKISFTYARTVTVDLALVHDDGDLRFDSNDGAGEVTVALTTDPATPFEVAVDPTQTDPLLRVGLVSQPELDLAVDIDTDALSPFTGRQGFTAIDLPGGHYRIHRDQRIKMRDPDGRGVLTLEDLRYSTLPDLFHVTTDPSSVVDIALDVVLPDSLAGGSADDRSGTFVLTGDDAAAGAVWPTASDAQRTYGSALAQATGLSMVDGLTSLAQYTGTVLALQDAADVPFPNLSGGTSDLFAPGDRLLALLSTAASAQVVCGVSPGNPPTGVAAPGDTVYCQAMTAEGLGALTGISWSLKDGGSIVSSPDLALGEAPSEVVEISGSDGEPDLEVSFTSGGQQLTARSMPHTVQDVVERIGQLAGSSASAELTDGRLDVAVDISQASAGRALDIGNAGTLGALVGLTGLKSADPDHPGTAQAQATAASFDVGFGVQTGPVVEDTGRETYLMPKDASLLTIGGLSATAPTTATDLPARIGFLSVLADLTQLDLGKTGAGPAVELGRVTSGGTQATDPLPISSLLSEDGALDPDQLELSSTVTASIAFTATEEPLSGSTYATGTPGGSSGSAAVSWGPGGLPTVEFGTGYDELRVFDPVPAAFLAGTANVTPGDADAGIADAVEVDVTSLPPGTNLYDALNLAPSAQPVEVARHLLGDGIACQNVTVLDEDTLTCEELAPNGVTPWADDQSVQLIVLGDPFALRDSVIEGLSTALTDFDRITADNVTESPAVTSDQYTSTLPLVDLKPAQLAVEREALRQGLAAIDEAATADEQGAPGIPVSSAQELAAAVDDLVMLGSSGGYSPSVSFDLGTESLGVQLVAHAPDDTQLRAPLRLDDVGTPDQPGRGQVLSGSTPAGPADLPVDVESTTTLAISVDRTTARPVIDDATASDSTARVARAGPQLAGHPLQAGVSSLEVLGAGSAADLGVRVVTDFVAAGDGSGVLETRRSNARPSGRAAVATLAVGADDVISYAADATDSSGGGGATQPAPDPMEVRFLAEGLDGLAAALGSAMDGAAPRNLDPTTGTPVSAPLIGTDLDAGAGVPDILTDLTSALRDELSLPAVADATTSTDLSDALDDAVANAVSGTDGLKDLTAGTVDVTVTCGGPGGLCDPCPDPPAATPCTSESPTGWKTVTVALDLEGLGKDGKATFETGLAGLEVRSDNEIDTHTSWTLPVTLQLTRGVGPQVVVGAGDTLDLDVTATMPALGIDAIVGYLPAHLTPANAAAGKVETTIEIAPAAATYDLFDLYDGALTATPSFSGAAEDGITLDFDTLAQDKGVFGLSGNIDIPWTAAEGFSEEVTYNDVKLDVGDVVAAVATPFQVVDPYLAPVRDVVDVLRTPIPVVSDLSELAGGDSISLLSLLETLSAATEQPQLELAHRVIGLVGGVTDVIHGLAFLADEEVDLEGLAAAGAVLSVDPSEVGLYEKCTQTITPTLPPGTTPPATPVKKKAPQPCPDDQALADQPAQGAGGQTTGQKRTGQRNTKQQVATSTRTVTGSLPGFSLPFLSDPDQLLDVLTGEGEASYFRLDLGTLAASVAYTRKFGPIMAGPVPIVPFVGGSISVEGRLAMGFDSYAQTLAARSVAAGDVSALLDVYTNDFDGGDVIREGFYIDDLDADGVDVPEVKLVTTLEAGAGVSIGIVTAGLKGGITLTINLDLNDPDDDGRLRTAEIRDVFSGDASCIFDVTAEIEAFISVFIEIELLLTSLEFEFDLLRLGPYELFSYGCEDAVPTLAVKNAGGTGLTLTTGNKSPDRLPGSGTINDADLADDFEVRQFKKTATLTTYEIAGFGRVQNVDVTRNSATSWAVKIYKSGLTTSTEVQSSFTTTSKPTFQADGGESKDKISFLQGEEYDDDGAGGLELVTTSFDTGVTALTGGPDDDVLVTGDADDYGVDGGAGNDSITLGLGDDTATGGDDNDVLDGGAGRDDLDGGAGGDHLEGGPGADRARGGPGNDSLVGGSGRDVRALLVRPRGSAADVVAQQVRLGFDSGDVLVGGPGADSVDGGDGSDIVVGGGAPLLTNAPATMASLFVTGERTVNVLVEGATEDDENVITSETVPVLTAAVPTDGELDTLCESGTEETGSGSTDFVTGGAEKDIVVGGNGTDTLDGGAGPDEVCGLAGDDQISGDGAEAGDGGDVAGDNDIIRGGDGDDRSDGGPGDDVMFGDDVTLVRQGSRVLDGSLDGTGVGTGDDYLDGAAGDDTLAGGQGSDLLVGDVGDDAAYGEGRDSAAQGGTPPPVAERLVACNATTHVVRGLIDLDGDLSAGPGGSGLTPDSGRLAGLDVVNGALSAPGSSDAFGGLLNGEVVVIDGHIDLDRDGDATEDDDDTGVIDLPSMLGTGDNDNGDCILAGDGNDELRGGGGSDYLGAGDGTDLLSGGDGNDLELGDGGTDVLLGGPHHDVLVGGLGDDHLLGGDGDDRLRGNEGADDLVGGNDTAGAADGQDVLLGGRGDDVLAAENGVAVSESVVDAVTDPAVPWTAEAIVPAAVKAADGSALRFDDSALLCGPAPATRFLTLLADDGVAGTPVASPGTPLAYDELYGGYDCDFVFGSPGDDLVRGGQDDDVVEAGPGTDIAYGDDGDDVVVGGSSADQGQETRITVVRSGAGLPDGGDTIYGDGGPDGAAGDGADLVAGDNALPTRVEELVTQPGHDGPAYVLRLEDVATLTSEPDAVTGGDDVVDAGAETDRVFGQGGDDDLTGGDGDDYVEGNDGADQVLGGNDADDVLGGSSAPDGQPLGTTGTRLTDGLSGPVDPASPGLLDRGRDTLDGGAGDDVVLGDNGRVTRPSEPGAPAGTTGFRTDGTRLRSVLLQDVVTATLAMPAGTGAADTVIGSSGRDLVFGQAGGDTLSGGPDDDYLEGNVGDDTLHGDTGEDDLLGGGSSSTGAVITVSGERVDDRLLTPPGAATDRTASGLVDGNDALDGGDQRDVMLGDNGRITRDGPNVTLAGGASGPHVVRHVAMADEGPGVWAGSDIMAGGRGDDDLYGQFDNTRTTRHQQSYLGQRVPGDVLDGGDGEDALVGDQGVDVRTPAEALGAVDFTLADSGRFIRELVRPFGTLVPVVTLSQSTLGGDDLLLGAGGTDSLHAGAGRDVANAGAGDDVVFAGDGGDALWGGTGHDRLFGGAGNDLLDIKRRTSDPRLWQLAAPVEDTDRRRRTLNGRDVLYGGAGADAFQADQGDEGGTRRVQGDRLIDWRSTTNFYKVCQSGYGPGRVLNVANSSMISTLRLLAAAMGSVGPAELAIPGVERVTTYPNQGSFVCETG